jgi:ribosomal protein L2
MFQINKNNKNYYSYFSDYFFNIIYIYRIASEGLKKGDLISFFEEKVHNFAIKNQYSNLQDILTGTEIFNIENIPNT